MINTGLVSITFRQLDPETIVPLVSQAELDAIEWGGDVHVPHGEVLRARSVRQLSLGAGIRMPSYGSYYRVGHGEPIAFVRIVDTALALGATVIRVWAGKQGSEDADETYWQRVIEDSIQIADVAEQAGLVIAYEFHANTLTDSYTSTQKLLEQVNHASVKTYWQPPTGVSIAENLEGLEALLPWLVNVHVFSWQPTEEGTERMPLAAMEDAWHQYFDLIATAEGDHHALLEFVRDGTPEQFLEDAKTLRQWVEPYTPDLPTVI